ncbi:hypothetical protein BV22DRAFT_1132975 [Leucogyrophana mollusca]|uniref:Uncharacterized protein n=1 Tax=Leucogyrophana mollusca TaxID=85980 RepID=A0ACB8B6S9_9AGAM|nr:hypothetical protein BV22DRAFT_1132975 [Leucogyrophana mollusca]
MIPNVQILLAVFATALAAQAQSTTSSAPASQSSLPSSLTPCILSCVTQAASSGGCSSFTDISCVCTSTAFQSAALSCLQANCTSAEVSAATQLQQTECAGVSSGSSGAASATSSGQASATSAGSPTSSSPAATSNAAMGATPLAFEGIFGTLVACAGAMIGGALML